MEKMAACVPAKLTAGRNIPSPLVRLTTIAIRDIPESSAPHAGVWPAVVNFGPKPEIIRYPGPGPD